MSPIILVILALVLPALGVAATLLLVRLIPLALFERSQVHGRFADLGAVQRSTGPRRAVPVGRDLPHSGLGIA